jgi:hypothetical protein
MHLVVIKTERKRRKEMMFSYRLFLSFTRVDECRDKSLSFNKGFSFVPGFSFI